MSTSDSNCVDGASKSNDDDDVCDVNDKLQNMSMGVALSLCANCGKVGANNTCNKCKQVRYCNAVCKKVHKKKHKKQCEELIRLATEKRNEALKHADELHDIELFKQPPETKEDCPICFLCMPYLHTGRRYQACCGKVICSGCVYAPLYDDQGNEVDNEKCAFCRTPWPESDEEEIVKRYKKRVDLDDPIAINNLGCNYRDGKGNGRYGYTQNYTKALELFHRAAELGYTEAYLNIGCAYKYGEGIEVDMEKANYYYELAAMRGNVIARHNLGSMEVRSGNKCRALRHYMISARDGYADSLKMIQKMYLTVDKQQKPITQKHYNYIKHIWGRLRVPRGIKLPLHFSRSTVITNT